MLDAESAGPVEANRYVQVGTKEVENFVIAVSVLFEAATSPARSNEDEALFQMRLPFAMELRTTDVIFNVFDTLTKIPSVMPATFLPARVSELEPTTVKLPSLCLTIASDVVEFAPICNNFEKTPTGSAFTKKPAFPLSVAIIPTTDVPLLSTLIAVGNKIELVGNVYVNKREPVALTFQIATACKSPINTAGGITALSGSKGVAVGEGAINPVASGVAPVIQISPAESTAAAVAIDAAD